MCVSAWNIVMIHRHWFTSINSNQSPFHSFRKNCKWTNSIIMMISINYLRNVSMRPQQLSFWLQRAYILYVCAGECVWLSWFFFAAKQLKFKSGFGHLTAHWPFQFRGFVVNSLQRADGWPRKEIFFFGSRETQTCFTLLIRTLAPTPSATNEWN